MSEDKFTLFTDGGSIDHRIASSACILNLPDQTQLRLVSFLGHGTNNEAELFSVLMGFALGMAVTTDPKSKSNLHWVADSEYSLKGLTQYIHGWLRNGWRTANKAPVKNQGLWRSIYSLSQSFNLEVEHVKGHSGHHENELCDYAVNWIRNEVAMGDEVLDLRSVTIKGRGEKAEWLVLDGRELLIELKEGLMPERVGEAMVVELRKKLSS